MSYKTLLTKYSRNRSEPPALQALIFTTFFGGLRFIAAQSRFQDKVQNYSMESTLGRRESLPSRPVHIQLKN